MQLGKIGTNIIRKAVVWAKTGKNTTSIIQTKIYAHFLLSLKHKLKCAKFYCQ